MKFITVKVLIFIIRTALISFIIHDYGWRALALVVGVIIADLVEFLIVHT